MNFASLEFVVFFLAVLALRACVPSPAGEKWVLLAASIGFYLSWSIPCILLILFTAMTDYVIGRRLGQTANTVVRRRLLVVSLATNLGLLGFFKYANFILENICLALSAVGWNGSRLHLDIPLPPGISFYTFASIGYVLDVYYERVSVCQNARDYTVFVSFFPKLLSGPIVRAREFLPQLGCRVRATTKDIEVGLACFMVGVVKKMVIADQIAPHVNQIFAAPERFDSLTLLQGVLGYAVQIYCDFSGYSDMAIGCARILGYRFPENFQMPFSASSITEFWRRWNMTLSKWFRDYVFLPLELATRSNPRPMVRVSVNLMLMMLLVGLWHGANWNFVVFGIIHGLALVIHKIWTTWNPVASLNRHLVLRFTWALFAHLLTLSVLVVSFIFFRAESFSDTGSYLSGMLFRSGGGTRMISPFILPALAVVIVIHLSVERDRNWVEELPEKSLITRTLCFTCLSILLACLGKTEAAPFIYFQF